MTSSIIKIHNNDPLALQVAVVAHGFPTLILRADAVLLFTYELFNILSANPAKWPTMCLSAFGHFFNLALKGLTLTFLCTFLLLLIGPSVLFIIPMGYRSIKHHYRSFCNFL